MPVIQLLDDQEGRAWFTLIAIGPIQRIPPAEELRYLVSERHLEVLRKKHIAYEEVASTLRPAGDSCRTGTRK